MSLKSNIVASYVSQIYVTVIGIVMVPFYLSYMGVEAYGLVGFFALLQSLFQLLDLGLTPTLAREAARFRGGAIDGVSLRRLLRALELLFFTVAGVGAAALIAASSWVAANWLEAEQLTLAEVTRAIILMALIVGLRWVSGLYRGVISGFEKIVWLSQFNAAIATAKFVAVIPFFMYVSASSTDFFAFQFGIAIVELAVLFLKANNLIPAVEKTADVPSTRWDFSTVRRLSKFSLGIAFTSSAWVLITQIDKLLLSKLLPLADYGYFTLAVLLASCVPMVSGPISVSLLPRMTRLHAQGDERGLMRLYRNATQLVAAITIPTGLTLAVFAKPTLLAWTGNAEIATHAAPVLALYAVGNIILALGALPYFLQFAMGNLALHVRGVMLFLMLLVPGILLGAMTYGTVGAGVAWLVSDSLWFVLWIPVVHRRFAPGIHSNWVFNDIGTIFVCAATAAAVAYSPFVELTTRSTGRWPIAFGLVAAGALGLILSSLGSRYLRELAAQIWLRRTHVGFKPDAAASKVDVDDGAGTLTRAR